MSGTLLRGVIHGRTIELEQTPELADGQRVSVHVQLEDQPPKWLARFTVDPTIAVGKLLIRGTRLLVEDVARLVDEGRSDEELCRVHPELATEDLAAVRQYVKTPIGLRRSFGGWAEDGEELDRHFNQTRAHRQVNRPEIEG